ncbi:hypothetical protein I302_104024 [Kwoniella bestiolae CBS 10118]|uniref:Uncharacterized protein n=1 Tax=Kwoniella bestiolae CBS 10118 TaxID=1296100 RepID=A0A1B9GA36_9TREE|nr:hypothetical protein I302_02729 [Kwoniella bestiolae CBS 10118]OCF27879.1 hypothetical protein I302_02729 [Kwoniella bestiolae CBS 10118]
MAQIKDLHVNQTSPRSKRTRNMDRVPSGPPPTYEQVEKLDSLPQALPHAVPHSHLQHHDGIETEATDFDATKRTSLSQVICTDPLGHRPKTKYGTVGIIAGIVFFPWGLFW